MSNNQPNQGRGRARGRGAQRPAWGAAAPESRGPPRGQVPSGPGPGGAAWGPTPGPSQSWGPPQARHPRPQMRVSHPTQPSHPQPQSQPPRQQPLPCQRSAGMGEQLGQGDLQQRMGALQIDQPSGPRGDGGRGAEGSVGRGGVRGRRAIEDIEPIIRTRPDGLVSKQGSSGTTIDLLSNFFKIERRPDWTLYQYRVDFSEEEDRFVVRRAWLDQHKQLFGNAYLFDGSMLFTTCVVARPDEPLTLVSIKRDSEEPVKIDIKFTGIIVDGNPVYIQIFNLILRRCMGKLDLQLVGRNLFDAHAAVPIRDFHLTLWPGYLTSIRQHERDLLLCCEFTHKVMREDTAYELFRGCSSSGNRIQEAFQQKIIGCIVLTAYNNKTYRVDDVDFTNNPRTKFNTKNGEISFVDYYRNRYNIKINDLTQPMLISRPRGRDIRGGRNEVVMLIPELCRMTGLDDGQRTNFNLMKVLAGIMFIKPGDRIDKLISFNRRLLNTQEIAKELDSWDVRLSQNLVPLKGRVLRPEAIQFGNGEASAGPDANWSRASQNKAFCVTAKLGSWVVITNDRVRNLEAFLDAIARVARNMGLQIPQPHIQRAQSERPRDVFDLIENIASRNTPDLIMVVVSNNNAERYGAIKRKCYVDRAINCQVVTNRVVDKPNPLTIATKVAVQINCKLGGTPWSIKNPLSDVMVVGFDVCHDKQDKSRSYGALVASSDGKLTKWFSSVTHHRRGEELSNSFGLEVGKALKAFQQANGKLPSRIFIYRDGVGDGQLNQVLNHEVKGVKNILNQFYGGPHWKLVFIVVTKRINARVFQSNRNNAPPGTIVDDVITLPEKYDFYLISQNPLQGTASPCSYNILEDNSGLDTDKLQQFTYKMCHLYYNYSGTVCVPAPCQYAHKLAFLVGQHLLRSPNVSLSDRLFFI